MLLSQDSFRFLAIPVNPLHSDPKQGEANPHILFLTRVDHVLEIALFKKQESCKKRFQFKERNFVHLHD